MDTVKCMNYADETFDTGVKFDDVDMLFISVVTGDEIITALLKDGTKMDFDSAIMGHNLRLMDYWDDQYIVSQAELDAWSKRKSTYDMEWRHKK